MVDITESEDCLPLRICHSTSRPLSVDSLPVDGRLGPDVTDFLREVPKGLFWTGISGERTTFSLAKMGLRVSLCPDSDTFGMRGAGGKAYASFQSHFIEKASIAQGWSEGFREQKFLTRCFSLVAKRSI